MPVCQKVVLIFRWNFFHDSIVGLDDLNADVSSSEIVDATKGLKSGKAADEDGILSEMLKCSCTFIVLCLYKLSHSVFSRGHFPRTWRNTIIIPLHKKGSYSNPDNYHGISLIGILCKMFPHIVNTRLQKWVGDNEVIMEE